MLSTQTGRSATPIRYPGQGGYMNNNLSGTPGMYGGGANALGGMQQGGQGGYPINGNLGQSTGVPMMNGSQLNNSFVGGGNYQSAYGGGSQLQQHMMPQYQQQSQQFPIGIQANYPAASPNPQSFQQGAYGQKHTQPQGNNMPLPGQYHPIPPIHYAMAAPNSKLSNSYIASSTRNRDSDRRNQLLNSAVLTSSTVVLPQSQNVSLLDLVKNYQIPSYEAPQCSTRPNGILKAFGTNTHGGLFRPYNEDRISIIINVLRPPTKPKEHWPRTSFFGIFDGHGGYTCAEHLKNNLYLYITNDENYPYNIDQAIKNGFDLAEGSFMSNMKAKGILDKSGTCALVAMVINDSCYMANVGDSRAVLSMNQGKKVVQLTKDHKPLDEQEYRRVTQAGGQITQLSNVVEGNRVVKMGPYRVFPGGLAISRTFGDIEAKDPQYGGKPNVILVTPDITSFKVTAEHDFIILASDGIYDVMTNDDIVKIVWETVDAARNNMDVNTLCGHCADNIMKLALHRQTNDNVSVTMIALEGFEAKYNDRKLFSGTPSAKNQMNQSVQNPNPNQPKSTAEVLQSFATQLHQQLHGQPQPGPSQIHAVSQHPTPQHAAPHAPQHLPQQQQPQMNVSQMQSPQKMLYNSQVPHQQSPPQMQQLHQQQPPQMQGPMPNAYPPHQMHPGMQNAQPRNSPFLNRPMLPNAQMTTSQSIAQPPPGFPHQGHQPHGHPGASPLSGNQFQGPNRPMTQSGFPQPGYNPNMMMSDNFSQWGRMQQPQHNMMQPQVPMQGMYGQMPQQQAARFSNPLGNQQPQQRPATSDPKSLYVDN